jgi:hypothetical protein
VSSSWPIWLIGCVVLVVVGFVTAYVPRRRARRYTEKIGWSEARTAIDVAAVSRDAAPVRVAEAEELLARAESIAREHGGRNAARAAAGYARKAERLWRAANDE